MKYYINKNNEIFAYSSEQEMNQFAKEPLTEITEEQLAELQAPTAEELAEQAKLEAEKLRDEAMLEGADYNGYQVSFTKADGDGMLQVKAGFELGLTETNIKFANGTILPMTATDFPAFALWFVSKRNEFFV